MKKLLLLFCVVPLMAIDNSRAKREITAQPQAYAPSRDCFDRIEKHYNDFVEAARVPGSLAEHWANCIQDCSILTSVLGLAVSFCTSSPLYNKGGFQTNLVELSSAVLAGASAEVYKRLEKDIFSDDKKNR